MTSISKQLVTVPLRWRKKPVVIEAYQIRPPGDESTQVTPYWLLEAIVKGTVTFVPNVPHAVISTSEGDMRADPGDWIICGIKGELYPCKPDIFEATYEPA